MAIEYLPTNSFSTVCAMGKNNKDPFFHIGAKNKVLNHFLLAVGYERKKHSQNKCILGGGGYYGGFHAFYSCDISDKIHRIAVSFSPVQEKQLVQLTDFNCHHKDIFLYKKEFYYKNPFVSGIIKNITDDKIEVKIELKGQSLRSISETKVLSPHENAPFILYLSNRKSHATFIGMDWNLIFTSIIH